MKSNIVQSVSKNLAVLSIQKIITLSSTFLILLFLPRYLGPVDYGRYYLGLTIVTMFSLLVDFGAQSSIVKVVSRSRENVGHIISDSIGIRVILWAIAYILSILFSILAGYHHTQIIIIVILGIAMIPASIRSVLAYCYQGLEMMEYPTYGTISEVSFITIVGISALLLGVGPIGFAIITALSWSVNCLVCIKFANRLTLSLPRVNWKSAFTMLREGVPYFLHAIFGIIYYRIDSVMLSLMTPERVIGWYGASYRFFDSFLFVPSIFMTALFPALSRAWIQENESMARRFQRSLDFLFIVGVPISIGAFAFSGELINFFYGAKNYGPSILMMKIFSVGLMLLYIDWPLSTMLLASDKQRKLVKIIFAMIFVNIALNYCMIPYTQTKFGNGGIGSAIATLITEFLVMVIMILAIDKSVFSNAKILIQIKTIGAGLLMGCSIWGLAQANMGWIVQAILGSSVYLFSAYYLGAIQKLDIQLIKEIIPRRFVQRKSTQDQ